MLHVVFASIWGHSLATAKLTGRALWPAGLLGLAIAASLHGLYDFLTIAGPAWLRLLGALLILAIWAWRRHLIATLIARAQH